MEKLKTLKRSGAVLIAGLGGLSLAACGDNPTITYNSPGQVVSHSYDDPDTYIIMVGKIPVTQRDPEHFYLNVRQCGHEEFKDENSDGCGIFPVEVNEHTYNDYQDGEMITFIQ